MKRTSFTNRFKLRKDRYVIPTPPSRIPALMQFQALELQALLDEEERHGQGAGIGTSSASSCTPMPSPFTTVPVQSQSHLQPQLSASQLQGYEY